MIQLAFLILFASATNGFSSVTDHLEAASITNIEEHAYWGDIGPSNTAVGTWNVIEGRNKWTLYSGNMGDVTAVNPTWDVGTKTGFSPPGYALSNNVVQIGLEDEIGRPAMQAYGDEIGFRINSDYTSGELDTLPSMRYQYSWTDGTGAYPWRTADYGANATLHVELEAKMPNCLNENGAVSYLPVSLAIHDKSVVPARILTINTKIFMSNGDFPPSAGYVGTGELTFRMCPETNDYMTNLGEGFQTGRWINYKTFAFNINRWNLVNIVKLTNEALGDSYPHLSEEPDDYFLRSFRVGAEVNAYAGGPGRLGCAFKNIKVQTLY